MECVCPWGGALAPSAPPPLDPPLAPIANLYERQTRCVFTNLGYIQDFLLGGGGGGGGGHLGDYRNVSTCGQASLTEIITSEIQKGCG